MQIIIYMQSNEMYIYIYIYTTYMYTIYKRISVGATYLQQQYIRDVQFTTESNAVK